MKQKFLKIIASLIIVLISLPSYAEQRIISLAPDLTEILFAIGAGKEIIGTSAYSDYPQAAKKIPVVANAGQLNMEAIIAAKPTLVLAWSGNPQSQLAELKKFNIPIYIFAFNQISDIPKAIQQLGKLTQHQAAANAQAELFNKKLQQLKQEKHNAKPITIFYLLWQNPLMTIGNTGLINQAINFCGGKNIFDDTKVAAPVVSIAAVLQRNPEIIIVGFNANNWKNYWQQWPMLAAVKKHQLYVIDPSLLQRPGPRFILGMQQLCNIIKQLS